MPTRPTVSPRRWPPVLPLRQAFPQGKVALVPFLTLQGRPRLFCYISLSLHCPESDGFWLITIINVSRRPATVGPDSETRQFWVPISGPVVLEGLEIKVDAVFCSVCQTLRHGGKKYHKKENKSNEL